MSISEERKAILDKIELYEREGLFDRDVENDPETVPLKPGSVDYCQSKLTTRIGARVASFLGKNYFERRIKAGDFILKEVRGRENLAAIENTGAFITCNHFNSFDNYALYRAIAPALGKRDLYKIIREGNYTSYRGFFGYLFRHCHTLPLSSSLAGMRELMAAISVLLRRGEKILIYPEQAMWYNYRKPRPLKVGAFRFAAKENCPVLPVFITLEDTDAADGDGYPVQAYTVHLLPAIFPDHDKGARENSRLMCEKNYALWKKTYEEFYGVKLEYTTQGEVDICSI